MGRSLLLDRELIVTDAALAVAAARQRGATIDPVLEADRLLKAFPGSGLAQRDLIETIEDLLASGEPAAAGPVLRDNGSGDTPRNADHLPSERADYGGKGSPGPR